MAGPRFDVAVVGAGLSGLSAAQRLEKEGLSVCIVEARDRIGGRMVASAALGAPFDAGAQFLHPNCTEMLELAARHGIETSVVSSGGSIVRSFAGDRQVIANPAAMFGDAKASAQVFAAIAEMQSMMAALPDGEPWLAAEAAAWDAITFSEWASARIADPVSRAAFVMRPTFDMALGWDNISLLAVLAHMKSGGLEKAMGIIVKVAGGAAALAEALASEISAELVLQTPVQAIEQHRDHVTVITSGDAIEARAVVVALSPALADRIAFTPPLPRGRTLLQRGWVDSPSTKTLFVYDRPWWLDEGLSGLAIGDRAAAPLVMDASVPGRPEGVLAAFSSCSCDVSDDAEILADIRHYFGELAASPHRIVSHDWASERWTTGCGAAPPPGLLSNYGQYLRVPLGRVFWAGTETAFVGSYNMEGAITAGQRAAAEVLDALSAGTASATTSTEPELT